MADLSFARRWITYVPDILGNRSDKAPFRIQVRRLSRAELDRFGELADEVSQKHLKDYTLDVERMNDLFEGVIRGPFGTLQIDGAPVSEGDMGPLLELAGQEFPFAGSIYGELVQAVIVVNELSETAAGNSGRLRGGTGTTQPPTEGAGSPRLEDAPSADASSSAAITSSASKAKVSRGSSRPAAQRAASKTR